MEKRQSLPLQMYMQLHSHSSQREGSRVAKATGGKVAHAAHIHPMRHFGAPCLLLTLRSRRSAHAVLAHDQVACGCRMRQLLQVLPFGISQRRKPALPPYVTICGLRLPSHEDPRPAPENTIKQQVRIPDLQLSRSPTPGEGEGNWLPLWKLKESSTTCVGDVDMWMADEGVRP